MMIKVDNHFQVGQTSVNHENFDPSDPSGNFWKSRKRTTYR